jgi:hypothetical protein
MSYIWEIDKAVGADAPAGDRWLENKWLRGQDLNL